MGVSEGVSDMQDQTKNVFAKKSQKKWTSLLSIWSSPEPNHSKGEVQQLLKEGKYAQVLEDAVTVPEQELQTHFDGD